MPQSYLSACTTRFRRLLASPDELRKETWKSMKIKYSTLADWIYDPPFKEEAEEELQRSHNHARCIPVVENNLTREFSKARAYPNLLRNLGKYYWKQRKRHQMREYCCSNLDWDWDTARCLQHLLEIKRPKESPHPRGGTKQGVSITDLTATMHLSEPVNGINRGTLVVTIPDTPTEIEKVRIRVTRDRDGWGQV